MIVAMNEYKTIWTIDRKNIELFVLVFFQAFESLYVRKMECQNVGMSEYWNNKPFFDITQ